MGPLGGGPGGVLPGRLRERLLDGEGKLSPGAAFLFCVAGTLMMVFLYPHELLLFALAALGAVAVLALDGWRLAKRFLVGMIVGGACENIAVALGGWSYAHAGYIYTPLWLPIGWGLSMALLDRAFTGSIPARFSAAAPALAFGGAMVLGLAARHEISTLAAFAAVTAIYFATGYLRREELLPGIAVAMFGTAMEAMNILAGDWHYSVARFGTPLWLPLCWLNSFLIMRRIMRIGEKEG